MTIPKVYGQWCVGDLLDALRTYKRDELLRAGSHHGIDVLVTDELRSYRGYYEDLALTPTLDRGRECTVGEVIDALESAVNVTRVFYGYKGGEYTMTRETSLWLALPGCTGAAIVGVFRDDYGGLNLVLREDR